MKILLLLVFAHLTKCQPKDTLNQNLQKLQELLQEKIQSTKSSNTGSQTKILKDSTDSQTSSRKSKSLAFLPFFPPSMIPFGPPPDYYFPQNKKITENPYPGEWLSRTEPFKKNPPLLDSPTYYIRLPPSPYVYVPGVGHVSRPPSLSDPELLDKIKPEQQLTQVGNDILHDPFYRLPINFLSNGKPTSVYQLTSDHQTPKPDSSLINLNKGPYVFNGKPSEIFLVAQIYDALYGDELTHFYP